MFVNYCGLLFNTEKLTSVVFVDNLSKLRFDFDTGDAITADYSESDYVSLQKQLGVPQLNVKKTETGSGKQPSEKEEQVKDSLQNLSEVLTQMVATFAKVK